MKTANLYVRVSTDEQAEKGYSQRNQEEVLRRYCEIKSIEVGKVYYEDHSAKTFNRPVWSKILVDLRKSRGQTDLILFTKWDRFSRNTGDAYYMINLLNKFGVEPQAIEQPLDLEIPENKMMLAFYLAAPEVENDRRGLNVFHGIRRAKKEGRWTSSAPVGYANLVENGRKYIAPKEPVASAMRKAFKDVSEGKFTLREIYTQAKENGINCGYNNFCNILRSPIYCGKIPVPKYKDEEAFLANGQHEPLISEVLFNRVQDILNGNIKGKATTISSSEYLQLRGFLDCPKCTRKLTGSSSKGQAGLYYHYYHCGIACKWRIKAEEVNKAVDKEILKIGIREGYEPFYRECISKSFRLHSNNGEYSKKQVVDQIKALNARITQARDHFMAGEFTHADFQAVKNQCEIEINSLEKKLPDIILSTKMVDQKLNGLMSNLNILTDRYKHGDTEQKRRIISSIHPQNIGFDGLEHRTNRINETVGAILLINKRLRAKKNWTSAELSDLSSMVVSAGIEPATQGFSVLCSTD